LFPPHYHDKVRFTLIFDNLYKRLAIILAIAGLGLSLGWMIVSNFIVRGVADRRTSLPREWLAAAVERFPNSARINIRAASAEIGAAADSKKFDARAEMAEMAESHAEHAVNLSPWNYHARSLLALAQELNGKQEEAEKTLRAAIKLAPNNAQLNWAFANLLMRRGKLSESLGPLRIAVRSRGDLLPNAMDTIWRFSDGGLDVMTSFAGDDTEMMLAVVNFLADRKLFTEADAVFNSIDKQAKAVSPKSAKLINALMQDGQFDRARTTWVELMTAMRPETLPKDQSEITDAGTLIWNGGFEFDDAPALNQFNWLIRPDKFAWAAVDRSVARTGGRALKVVFSGLDTTRLRDQIQQIIVLKPGASYHLECYARAEDLVTPEGPRIAVIGQNGLIGESAPVSPDSTDWQKLTISFVVPGKPAREKAATVSIVRTPKFSYDDPTSGTIWFDDFTLTER
jgi:tetratricopeptide (TPR) repeat protein